MGEKRTGVKGFTLGLALPDEVEQLGGHHGAGVRDLLGATLGDNVGGAVRALDALVARRRPPSLDLLELSIVQLVLSNAGLLRLGEQLEGVGGRDGGREGVGGLGSSHAGRGRERAQGEASSRGGGRQRRARSCVEDGSSRRANSYPVHHGGNGLGALRQTVTT